MKNVLLSLGIVLFVAAGYFAVQRARGTAVPSPFAAYGACTSAEAVYAGEAITTALNAGDATVFDRYLPFDDFMLEVIHDIPMGEADRAGFVRGARSSLGGGGFGQRILQNAGEGTTFSLLRAMSRQDAQHVLIRMVTTAGACNYFDLTMAKSPAGQVRIRDVMDHLSGQPMSANLRSLVVPLLAAQSRTPIDRLVSGGADEAAQLKRLGEVQGMIQRKEFRAAMDVLNDLPPAVARSRGLLMARIQVAQQLGDEEYQKAMEALDATFPGDPSLALMQIDRQYMKGNHAQALAAARLVDASVGGDPRLKGMMATLAAGAGLADEAKSFAATAQQQEPERQDIWLFSITASLALKDHAETARLMREMTRRFSVTFAPEQVEAYRDFCASPEYAQWKAGG
jgi:hypothetical protein